MEPRTKEIRFHIPEDLVGMAIGREGANVNEARRIPGVTSVEFDDYSSMFSVKGDVRLYYLLLPVMHVSCCACSQ